MDYRVCKNCGVKVFVTKANPNAICEYRHCRHDRNDDSTILTDEQHKNLIRKYIGKSEFVVELGEPIRCIDIKYPNLLICVSDWYPDQFIFTVEEFEHILKTQTLLH